MSDNEVLDAVRQTLSDVHMDRPLETIVQRGRNRRRVRVLCGVASGGLAVVVGAALAVPMLAGSTGATPPRSSPALEDGSTGSPQLELDQGRRSTSVAPYPRISWACLRRRLRRGGRGLLR
jgi:hypothetical protein